MKKKVCMIVQDKDVKGGISSVVNGYRQSKLKEDIDIIYVESYKDGSKTDKIIKAIKGYIYFVKVLITNKPNIIHIHSSFGASFYRKIPFILMSNMANIPVINHIHGADFDTFYKKSTNKKKTIIKYIYNKCSKLIVLSEEWKDKFKDIVPEEDIVIIENYSILNEEAATNKINRNINNNVLFLGEIGKRKGCYDIPRVIEIVAREIPSVKFTLAGNGNIDKIQSMLKEKGLDRNVIFTGWVINNEKDELLKKSDIFFLPSYNEGMPMAILDAMGYGLPIVSTTVGGIPKIVVNGKNGYTLNPGDIEGFAKAIITLLKNTDKLREYSKNSYSIVKEKYSLETHIGLIKKVYENL